MISARIREAVAKRYWLRKPLVAFFTCAMPICCSIVSAEEPYQVDWIRQFGTTPYDDIGRGIAGDGLGNVYVTGNCCGDPFIAKYSADGSPLWNNPFGTDGSNTSHGIWTDDDGNSYVSGWTTGDLGRPVDGPSDAVVLRYDPLGEAVWVRQFGTSSGDSARDISGDGLGNLYIVAGLGNDESIAKYGVDGTHQWTEQLPFDFPEGGESEGVAADGLGNVFITGYTVVEAVHIGGAEIFTDVDIFIVKYDAEGTLAWQKEFETSNPLNFSYAAAADGLGNVYITGLGGGGALLNKYDADGELLWTRLLGTEDKGERGYGVATDSWGNVYITGETTGSLGGPFAGGRSDIFVAKYDADGRHLWSQQFGTDGIDVGNAIWADSLGNVYVTGEMQRDAFVAKLIPADVAFLPGDINGDGTVNLADFSTLKANFGSDNATRAMGDLDGDMLVDINDFNILKANFGNTATVTAISCAGLEASGCKKATTCQPSRDWLPQISIVSETFR